MKESFDYDKDCIYCDKSRIVTEKVLGKAPWQYRYTCIVKCTDETYELFVPCDDQYYDTYIGIKYCPMCGRKL